MNAGSEIFQIDPATNHVVQEFLNTFVEDPAIRLDVEMFLSEAAQINPYITGSELANLAWFSDVYKDPKYTATRPLVKHAANQAVLRMLHMYHEHKGRL